MRILISLSGIDGTNLGRVFGAAVNTLCADNEAYLTAVEEEGTSIPDTVRELGTQYRPWKPSSDVQFRSIDEMLEHSAFACGDAAAYECAVLRVKYGIDAHCFVKRANGNIWHALVMCPNGRVYGPPQNFLDGNTSLPAWVLRQKATLKRTVVCFLSVDGIVCDSTKS